jgi:hypothetical protein
MAEDLRAPTHAHGGRATLNRKCPDNGGFGQTILIIPRVYISYTGTSDCWSEIRYVEIPIDFLGLHQVAKEKGDTDTQKIMSHGDLPGFFTWLLESKYRCQEALWHSRICEGRIMPACKAVQGIRSRDC